jgi:hypothetical protein
MLRNAASLALFIFLCACGGGGGGDASSSTAASVTATPEFTRGFAEFQGTPSATAVADLDGDGGDDVVVVTADLLGTRTGSEQLYVFYQTPTGPRVMFAPTASASVADKSVSTAVCDVDGDGRNEILVGYAIGDLGIYKPAADGTPVLWRTLAGVRSSTVLCGDVDGDGLSDVITTGKPGATVQVLLQRAGELVEPTAYAADGIVTATHAVGDIDGDGKPDLVYFGRSGTQGEMNFYARLQTAPGQFGPAVTLDFPRDEVGEIRANRVAVAALAPGQRNVITSVGTSKTIVTTHGAGGTVVSSLVLASLDAPGDVGVRDLNRDGLPDIVMAHDGQLGAYYQNADGTFTAEQIISSHAAGAGALAYGDFDSDGKLDIALASPSALFLLFQE